MGVNMAGYAIVDDEVCRQAACQEVIRRYYNAQCDYKKGSTTAETLQKNLMLMKQLELEPVSYTHLIPCSPRAEAPTALSSLRAASFIVTRMR